MGIQESASLAVILKARDEASAVIQGVSKEFGGLGVGALAVGTVSVAALAGVGAASVRMASEFERSLTMIHTQAGAVDENLGTIRTALLAMAPAVGTGPQQLIDAMYHVESAGFRGKQALDMVREAAKLAQVGQANLEDTTQAVVGTMAAFEKQGMTAGSAVAQLNAIVGTGDMRMEQLAKAMATGILPTAATFGLHLKDVGAALATLTDNVTPADEAATRLRMTFSMLGAPTGNSQKALAALGLNATQLANDMRKPDGLLLAVTDLKNHLSHIDVSHFKGGVGEAMKELEHFGLTSDEAKKSLGKLGPEGTVQALLLARAFGGGRSSAAIMTLLTEFDRLQSKYSAITTGTKGFANAWAETQSTFAFKVDQTKAAVQSAGIAIGEKLLPILSQLLDKLIPCIPTIAQIVIAIGTNLVTAIGLAFTVIGTLVGAISNIIQFVARWHVAFAALAMLITGIMLPSIIALTVTGVRSAIESLVLWTMYTWEHITATVASSAALVWKNLQIIGGTVAMVAARVATVAWTATQWLLNAALSANPIGLVILAVVALAAIVIYAYTHVGAFRTFVNNLWGAMQVLGGIIVAVAGHIANWVGQVVNAISHNQGLQAAILMLMGPLGVAIGLFTHLGAIVSMVAGWIHGAAGAVGSLASALSNLHVPNISLPHFASGGLVGPSYGGARVAVVGEGGADEAITPVDKLYSMIQSAVRSSGGSGGGGGGTIVVPVNLDGREIARVVLRRAEIERKLRGGTLGSGA